MARRGEFVDEMGESRPLPRFDIGWRWPTSCDVLGHPIWGYRHHPDTRSAYATLAAIAGTTDTDTTNAYSTRATGTWMPRWYAPCVHGALPVSSTGRVQGLRSQLWQKMYTLK